MENGLIVTKVLYKFGYYLFQCVFDAKLNSYGLNIIDFYSDTNKLLQNIHTDTVTGLCMKYNTIFTSSLDKTVKIWNLKFSEQNEFEPCNIKQIGQIVNLDQIVNLIVIKDPEFQKKNLIKGALIICLDNTKLISLFKIVIFKQATEDQVNICPFKQILPICLQICEMFCIQQNSTNQLIISDLHKHSNSIRVCDFDKSVHKSFDFSDTIQKFTLKQIETDKYYLAVAFGNRFNDNQFVEVYHLQNLQITAWLGRFYHQYNSQITFLEIQSIYYDQNDTEDWLIIGDSQGKIRFSFIENQNRSEPSQSIDRLIHEIFYYVQTQKLNLIIENPSKDLKIGNLFLGSEVVAANIDLLKKNNIQAVITIMSEIKEYKNEDGILNHLKIIAPDSSNYIIFEQFDKCIKFINENLSKTNVLVHCQAGISRSSTIIIAYIMEKFNKKFNETLEFVKKKRSIVNPNPGFRAQLQVFEKLLELR